MVATPNSLRTPFTSLIRALFAPSTEALCNINTDFHYNSEAYYCRRLAVVCVTYFSLNFCFCLRH